MQKLHCTQKTKLLRPVLPSMRGRPPGVSNLTTGSRGRWTGEQITFSSGEFTQSPGIGEADADTISFVTHILYIPLNFFLLLFFPLFILIP